MCRHIRFCLRRYCERLVRIFILWCETCDALRYRILASVNSLAKLGTIENISWIFQQHVNTNMLHVRELVSRQKLIIPKIGWNDKLYSVYSGSEWNGQWMKWTMTDSYPENKVHFGLFLLPRWVKGVVEAWNKINQVKDTFTMKKIKDGQKHFLHLTEL